MLSLLPVSLYMICHPYTCNRYFQDVPVEETRALPYVDTRKCCIVEILRNT